MRNRTRFSLKWVGLILVIILAAFGLTACKKGKQTKYEIIATDAVARYKKARGFDVFFCTGTDEHGQKIENGLRADFVLIENKEAPVRKAVYAGGVRV